MIPASDFAFSLHRYLPMEKLKEVDLELILGEFVGVDKLGFRLDRGCFMRRRWRAMCLRFFDWVGLARLVPFYFA